MTAFGARRSRAQGKEERKLDSRFSIVNGRRVRGVLPRLNLEYTAYLLAPDGAARKTLRSFADRAIVK
jgi:hypothetical protein